jgi:chemotaxis protein methyltransferase CheR
MLTDQQFARTRRLALNLAGIELADRHRELLERRGRRMEIADSAAFEALLCAAEQSDAAASRKFLHLLTTKFTEFFRHPAQLDAAAEHAFRVAGERSRARLWSAAGATGEEPYSLAIALIERFGRDDPPASVLATDVDADALAVATRGEYSDAALRPLSAARRGRFLNTADSPRQFRIADAVRGLVDFRVLNLAGATWPVAGPFDVILCRNALMYLETGQRHRVVERMASLLAPGGLFLLDPVENLGSAADLFAPIASGVYVLRRATGRRLVGPHLPDHPHP